MSSSSSPQPAPADVPHGDHVPGDGPRFTDTTMRRRWLLLFATLFPLTALWAITNPMFASPDEPAHMVRAQSIAAGDFSIPFTTDGIPVDAVECFKFEPEVAADCQDLTWGESGTQQVASVTDYPPLFHAIAAVPALVFSGLTGAYVMRLWLAVVSVAIVAWAGVLLTRPGAGPWPLTGLALATTPMVVFTMSTVNPSGIAAATSMLYVAGMLSLRTPYRRHREVIAAIVVGAAGLALARRDGFVWLLIVTAVLVPVIPFGAVRSAVRRRSSRTTVAAVVGVGAVLLIAAVWASPTFARFFRNWQDGGGTDAWEAARYVRTYVYQLVGVFGWLDSPIGEEVFAVALIAAGFVTVLGLVGTDRRLQLSTILAVAALVLTPVGFGLVRFPYLQGRYLFPVWVCLMLVAAVSAAASFAAASSAAGSPAAASWTDDALSRRATAFLLGLWAVVHLVGVLQNLRRYTVGRSGSWGSIVSAEWDPFVLSNTVALVALVGAVIVAGCCLATLLRAVGPVRPLPEGDETYE